jgi:hypothetical protein
MPKWLKTKKLMITMNSTVTTLQQMKNIKASIPSDALRLPKRSPKNLHLKRKLNQGILKARMNLTQMRSTWKRARETSSKRKLR